MGSDLALDQDLLPVTDNNLDPDALHGRTIHGCTLCSTDLAWPTRNQRLRFSGLCQLSNMVQMFARALTLVSLEFHPRIQGTVDMNCQLSVRDRAVLPL
jgi:hypothetical protein